MGTLVLAAVAVAGPVAGAESGAAAASGCGRVPSDFNGDGLADLAIGEPGRREVGDIDTSIGAIRVVYGTATGLTGAQRAQLFDELSPGMPLWAEFSQFGYALATGYFDADCQADLAVGSPGTDAVVVMYGSIRGLGTAGSVRFRRADLHPGGGDPSYFGSTLAAGDFNGDGRDDLAAGDSFADRNGGAVGVLYGSDAGITTAGGAWLTQDTPDVPGDTVPEDRFGTALAVGDFDGDGRAELAVGVPGKAGGSGRVLVLPGTPAGVGTAGVQVWDQDSAGVPDGSEASDGFGGVLATGDVDGDRRSDLAVGAPGETFARLPAAGAVTLLRGGAGGLTATGAQHWHQDTPGVPGTAAALTAFGAELAWGDFNRDGRGDLAVGAPQEAVTGEERAGAVTVLYGRPTGLTAAGSQRWTQNSSGVPDTAESRDAFGAALRAVPLRGGYGDLVIGTPSEGGHAEGGTGLVTVVRGGPNGLTGAGCVAWPGADLLGPVHNLGELGASLG